jgi:Glycosyltransferase family 87
LRHNIFRQTVHVPPGWQGWKPATSSKLNAGKQQRWPLALILLVEAMAILSLTYAANYLAVVFRGGVPNGKFPFGDVHSFWMFARFIRVFPADQIYNLVALQGFELTHAWGKFYPYPYPPIYLLFIWPLGWLTYLPSCAWFLGVTFAAYIASVAGRDWRSPRLWLALAAPTTMVEFSFGQNGFLSAALMIGGFRLLGRWPFLGGIVLGGLSFKPQLFLLVPVVLLACRNWRGLAGLAVSVTGLVAATVVAFGPMVWVGWVQSFPALGAAFERQLPQMSDLMPTVAASLRDAGAGTVLANVGQAVVSIGVAVCLWVVFRRRGPPRALDVAALQAAVLLVTPYALIYDMPVTTAAVAIVIESYTLDGRPWRVGETTVLVAALLLPLVMGSALLAGWPVGPLTLLALLAVTVRAGSSGR